jgi:hypothetical protein
MTQQIINTGVADKGNGDPIRTAFTKVNANFDELYSQLAASVVVGATAPTGPEEGSLWWNSESGRMYVYFGTAWVDASPVDGAGISSTNELVNGNKTVSLGTDGNLTLPLQGKIMPVGDVNSFLTFNWGDDVELKAGDNLYLSGSVATIRTNSNANLWTFGNNGSLTFPDTTVQSTAWTGITGFGEGFSLTAADKIVTNKLYSTNLTQPTQHYRLELDTNGVVVLPDGSIINGSTIRGVAGTGELNYTGITIGPNINDAEKTWMWVDHANAYVSTNNAAHTWTFGNDGSLTAPGTISAKTTFALETADVDTLYETYQELIIQLTDAFAVENYTGQGYPASKDSYAAIIRAKALNPLIPDNWIPLSNSLRNAYFTWAASSITLTVDGGGFVIANGGGTSWRFDEATGLRFPDNTYQNTAFVGSALSLKSANGSQTLTLGNDGGLTLPDDSVIASYKPVTVIAATTTTQTISDSASAAFIQFVDTVDTASAFSTGVFTVPYTGYYQVNMSVYFSSAVALTSTSFLLIDTNLDFTKQVRIFDGNWSGSYLHYSTVISAAAGDAVRIAIRQVSGGDVDIISGSRLTIHRVSIS